MTVAVEGPTGSWATLLAFLEPALARSVETLVLRLQLLFEDDHLPSPGPGEPDGFGGIDRHGDLDRLLLTEWLLAEEEPLEFSRRLAMGEVSFLRREQIQPTSSTRVVALLDAGPDQQGAPRLVHLAGLVVLARRAESIGAALEIGLLDGPPGLCRTGPLPELARAWVHARGSKRPSAALLDAWLESFGPTDRVWIFGAERAVEGLRSSDAGRPPVRHLVATEHLWSDEGARVVEVRVGRRRVHLALPDPATAIALIRGEGLHRTTGPSLGLGPAGARFPRFTGASRRLVCRSDRPDELLTMSIPEHPTPSGIRVRRHRFPGPVLAAAVIGKRTVALVHDDGLVHVEVVGKPLAYVGMSTVAPADLGLDDGDIRRLVETDLATLLLDRIRLLVRLGDRWWAIERPGTAEQVFFEAMAPSFAADAPRIVRSSDALPAGLIDQAPSRPGARILLGALETAALEMTDGSFEVTGRWESGGGVDRRSLRPAAGDRVVAVTATSADGPLLLVSTEGGRILRLVGESHTRTLTQASGQVVEVAVHPLLPLFVVVRGNGMIEAFDLPEGRPIAVIRPRPDV